MNPHPPEVIKCALCGGDSQPRGFSHALQGPIGFCCHEDMVFASHALASAGFETVTLNPEHEK